jgi:hypothetical protein
MVPRGPCLESHCDKNRKEETLQRYFARHKALGVVTGAAGTRPAPTNTVIAHSWNNTNERKSFVLCVTIGAQSDPEYLKTIPMTKPKIRTLVAVSILKM